MWKLLCTIKKWHFSEERFSALGKEKFGLLKQIGSILIFAVPFLVVIVTINLTFIFFPIIPSIAIPLCILVFCTLSIIAYKTSMINKRGSIWSKATIFAHALYIIWGSTFIFGLICWFGAIVLHIPMSSSKCIFPLSVPGKIVSDDKGQIYCISRFYNRLQIFDEKGYFLRGWFINLPAGKYNISTNMEGDVCLYAKNNRKGYRYNSFGKKIGEMENVYYSTENQQLDKSLNKENFHDDVFDIQSPIIFPVIIKNTNSEHKIALYEQPFGLWLVTMPFPSFAFFVLLLFIEKAMSKRIKHRDSIIQ